MSESGTHNDSVGIDAHHPVVFKENFSRFAGRLQWAMLIAGAVATPAGAAAWFTDAASWIPMAAGLALFAAGIVWSQTWRRMVKRSWWGEKYGRWT